MDLDEIKARVEAAPASIIRVLKQPYPANETNWIVAFIGVGGNVTNLLEDIEDEPTANWFADSFRQRIKSQYEPDVLALVAEIEALRSTLAEYERHRAEFEAWLAGVRSY